MGRFIHASDERTPLLATADAYPVACTEEEPGLLNGGALDSGNRGPLKGPALDDVNPNPEDAENKPLPKVQIFLLCYARLVEPIAFFSIFPFINKMIWENGKERGVGEGDVGFYSGLIARAFSFFAFMANVGIFLGPLLGGVFSEPATQYPKVFGHIEFFRTYPYILPTLATGALGLTAAITSLLFVKETLVREKFSDSGVPPPKPMPTMSLLKSPGVGVVLLIYGSIMLTAFAYTAVLPVFWFTPTGLGGLGFTPMQISGWMAVLGLSQAIWLLLIFPPLHKKIASSQLALNDISPSPAVLGTLNAVALTVTSAVRAVTPASITPIFAAGVKGHILGGHLAWVVLVILALGLAAIIWGAFPKAADGKYGEISDRLGSEETDQ
ncbi:putative major facilitator superfamily transporter [Phaeomoniella chlamydospora]|uniref:Putative major facilitator superfamily transporter n=1 Tax=Phaeomoniella chlamydospora TaxID=158046 RepID=A0A0G2EWJ6_PHACM|nr:putative major facilitator superfamily transporter [Phaeomoniella chlamydospora]